MTANSRRALEVFTEAVQLPVSERAAFLDRVCAGEVVLRRKVGALLQSHDRAGDFLERPPTGAIDEGRAKVASGEKPGDRVGRYRILEQLGEGGCGVVFLAQQEDLLRRRVALKIIKPGMDSRSVIARFEAERQALALMDHPNIAKIFDAGTTDSRRPYFVMELVRGVKITEYCDQNSLTTEERLGQFVQVCRAVQHAHQKGVIHRDIKPSNILVARTVEGMALPVVIDFGIAKATASQRLTDQTIFTSREMLIGTPAYMSPEQAEVGGMDVDTRSDIYSLGVLLYELLTGSTPIDSGALLKSGLDEMRRAIREREPDRPSTRLRTMTSAELTKVAQRRQSLAPNLIRSVRGDLDWIVMKALEKDRARRYETANGLALDVERHLSNEAISARPPSKTYKFRKLVMRNKVLFASAGLITLLLLGSLIMVSIALANERQAFIKSQQVTTFLEEMLQGVGPSVALGEDTRLLRRIVDQTAERVGKEMAGQPIVEAELCSIIGKLYGELGYPGQGEAMVRRALAIQQEEFGSDSLETAASWDLLGGQLMGQSKRLAGAQAYSEALAIRRRLLGSEHVDTAMSLSNLGAVYGEEGKVEEAEAMAREALRISRQLGESDSPKFAAMLRNLCMILGNGGKWAEAEKTARELLQVRRKLHGPDHPSVAAALRDLAWAVNATKRFDEAQSLEAEAAIMQEKLLGGLHPDVTLSLNSLGKLLGNRGDIQASEAVLKGVLSIQRKMLGEDHAATLETLSSLAKALQVQGKRQDAESTWRQALAAWDKRGEIDKPDRLYVLRGLGEALEEQGKWPEAEAIWRESLLLWRGREGVEGQQSMYTLRKLAQVLEAGRNWREAEMVHREALTISSDHGDEGPEALADREKLIRVLMAQKHFAEAEELLDGILSAGFVGKPASVNLLVQRVDLMARQGRWREAAADVSRVLKLQPAEHYHYHRLSALLAIQQDRNAYEQLCQKLAAMFPDSSNPYVNERVGQDCLLLPDSGVDLRLMDKLADRALTIGSDESSLAYFRACKAMARYRLGDYGEAAEWAERASGSPAADPPAKAKAFAILAMAKWQLGQADAARAALDSGDLLYPQKSAARDVDDLGESWVAWIFARISLNEAAAIIQHPLVDGGKSLQP